MKHIAIRLLLIFLVLQIWAPVLAAQNAADTPASIETADDDHLPFMRTEQNPQMEEPGTGTLIYKTLGALLLIVGLLFAGAWAVKKFGLAGGKINASAGSLELTMLSTLSLGNGRTISSVRFGSRILLVGSTPQSFTLLAEETDADDEPMAGGRGVSVAEMLAAENASFDNEFELAQSRLDTWAEEKGGRTS